MKKLILLLFVVGVSELMSASKSSGFNDAEFKQLNKVWAVKKTQETSTVSSDGGVLKIATSESDDKIRVYQEMAVVPGETYSVSFKVQQSGPGKLNIGHYPVLKQKGVQLMVTQFSKASAQWQEVSFEIATGAEWEGFRLCFSLTGKTTSLEIKDLKVTLSHPDKK